ncbi:hypothetical protein OAG29_02880, partial [Planctomycetaceae bacterium]|nr:hypothetical protein [Planctomycetaceae bacterium]
FRSVSRYCLPLLLPVMLATTPRVQAVEQAAEFLPSSTVLYAEMAKPAKTIEALLQHSIADKVRDHEAYQQATKTPQYHQFQMGLKFVEAQLGMKWLEAVHEMTDGGVTLAVDAKTEGVALIFKTASSESLETLKTKVMQFARQDAKNKGNGDPYEEHEYRGHTVYKADKVVFTTNEEWLLIANKPDLGRHLLDGLLDGPQNSLMDQTNFQTAYKSSKNKIAWGYTNLEMIRNSGIANKVFSGKADNPGLEVILGGVLEILPQAAYVTAALDGLPENLQLTVALPFQPDWISESREYYFGPNAQGSVTSVRTTAEPLISLSVYRNLSEIWLRAGDLFNAEINDGFAKADATLTTLFSGKDFGEDILASLSPELQLVIARQNFSAGHPSPEIKLPGFALVTRMKDVEHTRPEFRRIFMSFIGFLNVVAGSEEGRAQLDLDLESFESGEIISTRFVPLAGSKPYEQTNISYNFTPSVAFQDDLFILSSSSELARGLLSSQEQSMKDGSDTQKDSRINLALNLTASGIRRTLEDNREHLIAQNMLEKGHSREEAEGEIGIIFEVLKLVESAGLRVLTTDKTFEAQLKLSFSE